MIQLIPFLMVPVAFWMHRDNSSNLAAIGAFIVLYALMLLPHNLLDQTEYIFIINALSASALSSLIKATCRKPSLLIVLFLLTCFVLTILNATAFIAYNYYSDALYQAALYLISVTVGLQWAALWVRDDTIGTRIHYPIFEHLLDWADTVLHRSKIH